MKPEIELAQLVVDWSKIDDKVAEQGWDGGERDGEWDNCKNAMVAVAQDILEGDYKPKKEDVELQIIHGRGVIGYGKDGVIGMGLTVHPASSKKEGFISLRMISSEPCKIRENALEPIHLFFSDLCGVLSVMDGLVTSVNIFRKHGVLPVSRVLSVAHYISADNTSHGFNFTLSTEVGEMEGDEPWSQKAEFFVGAEDGAIGVREVIRHAMLLVGCGIPGAMRKAGE